MPGAKEGGALEDKAGSLDDSQLIARCQQGELEAFDLLVERYQTRIYNLCLWHLGDREEASDAAQEVFVRAWRALPRFRGEAAFGTWLHRIAINVSSDAAARRRRTPLPWTALEPDNSDTESEPQTAAPPHQTPHEILDRRERHQALRQALAGLPEHHRIVLVLFYIEGLPYDEVAGILKMNLGTLKSRLNRARAELLKRLEDQRELFLG